MWRRKDLDVPSSVCKHCWAVTSQLFLNTCIFVFEDSLTFRDCAKSDNALVARIRQIRIFAVINQWEGEDVGLVLFQLHACSRIFKD